VKTYFVILLASMMGCASIPRLPGATTRIATPAARVVRGAAASAGPDLQRQTRTFDRHVGAIDLSTDPSREEVRSAISPTPQSTSTAAAGAALTSSTLRPGEWSRDQWITLLTDVLSNEKLAHAAAWIGRQPLNISVSGGGFSIAVRVPTP
jgi:hypothetical protein